MFDRGRALVVSAHLIERVLPRVALVFNELLEDAQRSRLAGGTVGQPARDGRDVLEARVGQRLADLEVRVDARLEPAEDLQDQPVAERDAGIALLTLARPRIKLELPA